MKYNGLLITKKSIIVFLISLLATFLMVVIPHLKPQPTVILSPKSTKINVLENVKPKLEQIKNQYQLKKPVISAVSAGSEFEDAKAYGVIDLDSGEVIASKNLTKRLPVASLTKIMTAVVSLDLASEDEEFVVSKKAAAQIPTKVMLKEGEKYTLEKLLNFMLISSANDSAQVIKEGIDAKYGGDVFINAMNLKAKSIGLKNTHFSNPQGFDGQDHFSSVEDLSVLSYYALKEYPLIKNIVSRDYVDLTNNLEDKRFYLNNWNGLFNVYPGVFGVKIGNTNKAEFTTVVGAQREGIRLLAVVLGAPGALQRDLWASQLLDLGFQTAAKLKPVNVTVKQLKAKYLTWKYWYDLY